MSCKPARPRRADHHSRAFSLLEIMVVLVIIGLILGLVTVNVVGQLKGARHDTAVAQIATIMHAIDMFYLEQGRYPTNDEGLDILTRPNEKTGEPLMRSIPRDPWGNAYQYNSPGLNAPYEIISFGADGQEGGSGADRDIVSWEIENRRSGHE
jgi:general secretion pathway protein G